jgi:pyrrolidone-carboxylate peptidase
MKKIPIDLEIQKEAAKIGMTATLGATVVTSMFMKNGVAKKVHVVAGVAFCGFALWHHMLYQPKNKQIKKPNPLSKS